MIRNVLQDIGGVELFPLISLVIFVAFFGGMMWRTIRLNRTHVNHMGNLPLEDGESMASKEIK